MEGQVAEPHRLFDDSFLRFLPKLLREPRRPWLAVPAAVVLTLLGSTLLSFVTRSFLPELPVPVFPMKGGVALFLLVVFAPLVETLIMAGLIGLLRFFLRDELAVLGSAVAWGIAHSLEYAAWGLVIWWPFLIFSMLYVVWRQRGFWFGIAVAASAHALQNLGPALTVAYPHLFSALG